MAIRFRKSVKICKGLKVNFSKSGASLSIGGRGHSLNLSNRGTTVSVGLPGTGLSWQTRISPHSSNTPSRPSATGSNTSSRSYSGSRPAPTYDPLPPSVDLSIGPDGRIVYQDATTGSIITDQSQIRKLRAMPYIKHRIERLQREQIEKNSEIVVNQTEELERFLNLHRLAPTVITRRQWSIDFANLKPESYQVAQFDVPMVTDDQIRRELQREAELNVRTPAFWKLKQLQDEYVSRSIEARRRDYRDKWQLAKDKFDAEQQRISVARNAEFVKQFEEARRVLEGCIKGEVAYVEEAIDEWFASCSLPVEIDINYLYRPENGLVSIDMDLPEIEDIPTTEFSIQANGTLKEKKKTQTTLRQEYATLVFGLAIFVAANVFNASPAIKTILISGYTQRPDKDGVINDDYIYSIKLSRKAFESSEIQSVSPPDFCLQFENRCKMTSTQLFKAIIPFSPEEI